MNAPENIDFYKDRRITGLFILQHYRNDNDDNPLEDDFVKFDATEGVLSLPYDDVVAMADCDYSDYDTIDALAPAHLKRGPFRIAGLEESTNEFFDGEVTEESYAAARAALKIGEEKTYNVVIEHTVTIRKTINIRAMSMDVAERVVGQNMRNHIPPLDSVEGVTDCSTAVVGIQIASEIQGDPRQDPLARPVSGFEKIRVDLKYDGETSGHYIEVQQCGDPGVYDEVSVQIYNKDGESTGDVLVGLDNHLKPRVMITTGGDGMGEHSVFVHPENDINSAVEIENPYQSTLQRPENHHG